MGNDAHYEVYRAHREAQGKYDYFLLAVAGAGIALAVNQTQGATLAWSQLPLAGAVLFWAGSFWAGCRHLNYVASNLFSNLELLRVQSGQHPKAGTHPDYIAAASQGIQNAIESNADKAQFFALWQFRFLTLGAILYVGWHVWEMYLRLP